VFIDKVRTLGHMFALLEYVSSDPRFYCRYCQAVKSNPGFIVPFLLMAHKDTVMQDDVATLLNRCAVYFAAQPYPTGAEVSRNYMDFHNSYLIRKGRLRKRK
jgi:hypothetical protein